MFESSATNVPPWCTWSLWLDSNCSKYLCRTSTAEVTIDGTMNLSLRQLKEQLRILELEISQHNLDRAYKLLSALELIDVNDLAHLTYARVLPLGFR